MEGDLGKRDLEKYRVGTIEDMYYIPNYLKKNEQEEVFEKVYQGKWTTLPTTQRRLQELGGTVDSKTTFSTKLPEWLLEISNRLYEEGLVSAIPNHVLINEYKRGQGIMPHTDGPLYTPNFAIISLQSSLVMDFYRKLKEDEVSGLQQRKVCSLLLEPGSLLLIRSKAYTDYLHGIADVEEDLLDNTVCNIPESMYQTKNQRSERVSLTIRNVKKTVNMNKIFGKK